MASNKKMVFHERASRPMPPSKGALAEPTATAVVCAPSARPRSSFGNTATRIPVATDCTRAFPIAMTTRAAMSMAKVGLSPVNKAPSPKTATPMLSTRLSPRRSARPPSGSKRAAITSDSMITTQPTVLSVTSKSSAIRGSARKAKAVAKTIVMKVIAIAVNACHFGWRHAIVELIGRR